MSNHQTQTAHPHSTNFNTLGKQSNRQTNSFALTLSRSVVVKRYPIIAKVGLLRERLDLVSLLKSMQKNPAEMPSRLKAYLKRVALWDELGISEKGQQVVDSGLFEVKERALYHIWYTDNDRLLGTRPIMMQRDTAFFDPELKGWKKGRDALRSEFKVQAPLEVSLLEEVLNDHHNSKLKNIMIKMTSLEPEVICSPDESAKINLNWTLNFSESQLCLTGPLDLLAFNKNGDSKPYPQALKLLIPQFGERLDGLMEMIAHEVKGHWLPQERRLATHLEQIKHDPSTVQTFQIHTIKCSGLQTDIGDFDSAEAKNVSIRPIEQSDAEDWYRCWLNNLYSKAYHSSSEARKKQSEWLDHIALEKFVLPLKDQQSLLLELSRESQPESYWHVAAMTDLSPSKSKKVCLPISLINDDLLKLNQLTQMLSGNESITQVIYSDRYVHTARQSDNLKIIASCFADAKGLLLTLDHQKNVKLPDQWSREFLQKKSENHGRYWILISTRDIWSWECSSGLDFIKKNDGRYFVDGSPTFTPKDLSELPCYLRDRINHIAEEGL